MEEAPLTNLTTEMEAFWILVEAHSWIISNSNPLQLSHGQTLKDVESKPMIQEVQRKGKRLVKKGRMELRVEISTYSDLSKRSVRSSSRSSYSSIF